MFVPGSQSVGTRRCSVVTKIASCFSLLLPLLCLLSGMESTGADDRAQDTTATPNNPPNVLIIMTDQQRFDAIQYVQEYDLADLYRGHTTIRTPNMDRLIRGGAYFRNAYTQCPVCAPARTSLRTGNTIERTGVQHNDLAREYYDNGPLFRSRVQAVTSLDHVLVDDLDYVSEYYGKWHMPEPLLRAKRKELVVVENNVYDGDGDGDGGNFTVSWTWSTQGPTLVQNNDYDYAMDEPYFKFDPSSRKLKRYLEHFANEGEISKNLSHGEQLDTYTGFPYKPFLVDSRFDSPTGTPLTAENGFASTETSQGNIVGLYSLDDRYTPTFFEGDLANKALQRLIQDDSDAPWFVTVSFHSPHPPMIPAWRHLAYYYENRENICLPPNMDDPLTNSAYRRITEQLPNYGNVEAVREWTAAYYALIEEIDDHIGILLSTLEEGGDTVRENTLIVFTSDHGEMLGSHGKREKNNFYEESAKVPLVFYYPNVIDPGTVIDDMASHMDVFATILDYVGAADKDTSDGTTLRPLIERQEVNEEFESNFVVSEWDFRKPLTNDPNRLDRDIDHKPSFMVRKGNYKLMMQKLATSQKMDMMFDLKEDPYEMNNLLGTNAMSANDDVIAKAEHLRCLLVGWMTRLDGEEGYFSNPVNNYGEGAGDITEIKNRRAWRDIDFWVSDSVVEFGATGISGSEYKRHEHLYLGTRASIADAPMVVQVELRTEGDGDDGESSYFQVDKSTVVLEPGSCESIRISFISIDDSRTEGRRSTVLVIEPEGQGGLQKIIQLVAPAVV